MLRATGTYSVESIQARGLQSWKCAHIKFITPAVRQCEIHVRLFESLMTVTIAKMIFLLLSVSTVCVKSQLLKCSYISANSAKLSGLLGMYWTLRMVMFIGLSSRMICGVISWPSVSAIHTLTACRWTNLPPSTAAPATPTSHGCSGKDKFRGRKSNKLVRGILRTPTGSGTCNLFFLRPRCEEAINWRSKYKPWKKQHHYAYTPDISFSVPKDDLWLTISTSKINKFLSPRDRVRCRGEKQR